MDGAERSEHAHAQLVEVDLARRDLQPALGLRLGVVDEIAHDPVHAPGVAQQPPGRALLPLAGGGARKLFGGGEDHGERIAQLVPGDADEPMLEGERIFLALVELGALEGARR